MQSQTSPSLGMLLCRTSGRSATARGSPLPHCSIVPGARTTQKHCNKRERGQFPRLKCEKMWWWWVGMKRKFFFFLKKSFLNHIIRHIVSLSWLFPFFLLTVSKLAIASITCVIYVLEKGVCTLPDRKLQKKVSLHTPLGNYNHSKNCSTWHNSKQHITFSLSNLPN